MKFNTALSVAAVVGGVVAAPALHPRQSGCPAPTEASCVELHDRCVAQGASVLANPWNNRVCTAAATCYGVGNLLTSYACRLGVNPPTPSTLPSLDTSLFPNPTTQQNYVDLYYGSINAAWPASVNVVTGYWAPIISWINTGSSAPYNNLNDWFHWSSTPTTVTTGPTSTPTTTDTPTNTATPTPTTGPQIPGLIETCSNGVSISYDDGPYVWNQEIVNLYDQNQAKTTFFVNGNNWDCIYNQDRVNDLRYAYEHGHTIGSHTWFHTDITTISNAVLGAELDRLEGALWKILGIKPALFRPPYGAINQEKLDYLNSRGYNVVTWDVDTGDADGESVSYSMDQIRTHATDHSMILSHETYQSSAEQLAPQAIAYLRGERGFTLNSIDKCLNISPYQVTGGGYGTRDSSWTC